jgi:hypothetical protein
MSAAALLFWGLAAAKVLLSAPLQIRAAQARTPEGLHLARGQRKDDWLAMGAMLAVLLVDAHALGGDPPFGPAPELAGGVYLVGTVTLAWLVQRTWQRLRRLGRR